MSKEYYVKRYKPLNKLYKEYHNILLELKKNPNDEKMIKEKIHILKKTKFIGKAILIIFQKNQNLIL